MQFYIDSNRFALPAQDIIAIVPVLSLHDVPRAPEYVAGILNYHGESVPVIDMRALMTGTKAGKRLSTRIAIIRLGLSKSKPRLIGLLAEKLTEVLRIDDSQFKPSGVTNDDTKYLGEVVTDNRGILQRLNVSELLPRDAQKLLFS
ncbi:chemotaxis protein CheW [Kaarinaea lacus]